MKVVKNILLTILLLGILGVLLIIGVVAGLVAIF